MWDRIQRLHEHHGDVPLEIRILKITEEVGEVAEAFHRRAWAKQPQGCMPVPRGPPG
jgi:hypothetical protein